MKIEEDRKKWHTSQSSELFTRETFLNTCAMLEATRGQERLHAIRLKEGQCVREWARAFCHEKPIPKLEILERRSNRSLIRKKKILWQNGAEWEIPLWVSASQALGNFFRQYPGLCRWTGGMLLRYYNPELSPQQVTKALAITPRQERQEGIDIRKEAVKILRARYYSN